MIFAIPPPDKQAVNTIERYLLLTTVAQGIITLYPSPRNFILSQNFSLKIQNLRLKITYFVSGNLGTKLTF